MPKAKIVKRSKMSYDGRVIKAERNLDGAVKTPKKEGPGFSKTKSRAFEPHHKGKIKPKDKHITKPKENKGKVMPKMNKRHKAIGEK